IPGMPLPTPMPMPRSRAWRTIPWPAIVPGTGWPNSLWKSLGEPLRGSQPQVRPKDDLAETPGEQPGGGSVQPRGPVQVIGDVLAVDKNGHFHGLPYLEIMVHKGIDRTKGRKFPYGPIRGLVHEIVELGELPAHMVEVHPGGESLQIIVHPQNHIDRRGIGCPRIGDPPVAKGDEASGDRIKISGIQGLAGKGNLPTAPIDIELKGIP